MRTSIILITMMFSSALMARPATVWDKKLVKIANIVGVPSPLLAAVCWVESNHRPHATNWDDNGSASLGMCQIKYATAVEMGYKGTVEGLFDGPTNAKFAAKYIKVQMDKYGGDWASAAAAYNAGRTVQCNPEKLYFIVRATNSKGVVYKKKVPCTIGEFVNQVYVNRVLDSVIE